MIRRLLAVAFLALPLLLATPAGAASSGQWITSCPYSHSATDDPIVYPGVAGASHLHDFFGNGTTAFDSTYDSMLAGLTTCKTVGDTAGYWVPAVYRGGVRLLPQGTWNSGFGVRERIYYKADNISSSYITAHPVEAFPADFRLIAGNSHAASAAENPKLGRELYWGCADNSTGKLTAPPSSCSVGVISLHVGFPNCWDGISTGVNDTAHVVYPKDYACPAAFPRVLPRVIQRWEYPIAGTSGAYTLASGPPWTLHGDWWNTWDQARLEQLVARCITAGVRCGVDPA